MGEIFHLKKNKNYKILRNKFNKKYLRTILRKLEILLKTNKITTIFDGKTYYH